MDSFSLELVYRGVTDAVGGPRIQDLSQRVADKYLGK